MSVCSDPASAPWQDKDTDQGSTPRTWHIKHQGFSILHKAVNSSLLKSQRRQKPGLLQSPHSMLLSAQCTPNRGQLKLSVKQRWQSVPNTQGGPCHCHPATRPGWKAHSELDPEFQLGCIPKLPTAARLPSSSNPTVLSLLSIMGIFFFPQPARSNKVSSRQSCTCLVWEFKYCSAEHHSHINTTTLQQLLLLSHLPPNVKTSLYPQSIQWLRLRLI